jgi:restriction endonuclease fold toxin 7 of polymorphic toxin system
MRASIIRLGALLLAGALLACATSGGMGMTGRGGSGFESVSPPERIDACAGALIALRGATEELRTELDETRARKLVWRGEWNAISGRATHQVDWNPALEYLAVALGEVDARISVDLTTAASAHAVPTSQSEAVLTAAVTRSGDTLRVIGVYLAAIRAAQYALHDAPRYAVGGLGFNDGIIDRVERLRGSLESLRSRKPLTSQDNEALVATTAYIDSYFRGLQSGAQLMQAAKVLAVVNGAVGTAKAMAGLAQLMAGAAVEAGGFSYALAGAGAEGAVAAPAVAGTSVAGIQAVVAGVAVTTALLKGGRAPNDVGREGERRVSLTGPKERIPSLTGTAGYRVPDGLTKLTIEEVKNAAKLSINNQLRDFLLYAKVTGRTFILWVRSNTELVGVLKDWEARGLIKVERVL